MKNAWPVNAQALGGRHYRVNADGQPLIDQNFDSYSVEYTFADGTKFLFDGRCVTGAHGQFSSYIHGTKGSAIAARSGDYGGPAAIFANQTMTGKPVWQATDKTNPYQNEWDVLVKAIRNGTKHNEVYVSEDKISLEVCLPAKMGTVACERPGHLPKELKKVSNS
jgi:predicted dehydrogenase